MPINRILAGIAVADLDPALAWYERLLGRPADRHPMDGLAEWHMGVAGGIQLVRDATRAGTGLLTISVDDLEGYVAALAGRDLLAGVITTGEVARFVAVADPEGNTITLAESLGADDWGRNGHVIPGAPAPAAGQGGSAELTWAVRCSSRRRERAPRWVGTRRSG